MTTTHGLSHADLQEVSIQRDIDELRKYESRVAELEAKLTQTRNELAEAVACVAARKRVVQWKSLMAQVESDTDADELASHIEKATEAFRHSLLPPDDYDDQDMSYSDTDDYADLSALETVFEDTIDEVRMRLQTNCAKLLSPSSTRSSANFPKLKPHSTADTSEPRHAEALYDALPDRNDAKAVSRHKAMLLLLVLSVHAGHLESECGIDAIAEPSNRPTTDLDELRENVASQWSWALSESNILTPTERKLWQHVVTTFLGPRFDPSRAS